MAEDKLVTDNASRSNVEQLIEAFKIEQSANSITPARAGELFKKILDLSKSELDQLESFINSLKTDTAAPALIGLIELSNLNSIGGTNAAKYITGLAPCRYLVKENLNIVGILDVFSDSMRHVLTQVFTTHYVLANGSFGSTHIDTKVLTYYRSYSIGSPNITSGTWSPWKKTEEAFTGFFECSTPANTAAKTITINGFTLDTNCRLVVKMTNSNTVANATLNIDSTGAKPLFYNGERASASNYWEAGEVLDIYYDGTNFQASNIQGGAGEGGNMILTFTTDVATTRKTVKDKFRRAGLVIAYKNASGEWINEQYIGTTFTDAQWQLDSNWQKIASSKDVTNGIKGAFDFLIVDWDTDVATTRKSAPTDKRKLGMVICYKHPELGWMQEQFVGQGEPYLADGIFEQNSYWKPLMNYSDFVRYDVTSKLQTYGFVNKSGTLNLGGSWMFNYELIKLNKGEIAEFIGTPNSNVNFISIYGLDGRFIEGYSDKIYYATEDVYVRFSINKSANESAVVYKNANNLIENEISPIKNKIDDNTDNISSLYLNPLNLIKPTDIYRTDTTKKLTVKINTEGIKILQAFNYKFNDAYNPFFKGDYKSKQRLDGGFISAYGESDNSLGRIYPVGGSFYILPEGCKYVIWELFLSSDKDDSKLIKENWEYAVAYNIDDLDTIGFYYCKDTWVNSLTKAKKEYENLFDHNLLFRGYSYVNKRMYEDSPCLCISNFIRVEGNTDYFFGFDSEINLYSVFPNASNFNIEIEYFDKELNILDFTSFKWGDKNKILTTPGGTAYVTLSFGYISNQFENKSDAFKYALMGLSFRKHKKNKEGNLFDGTTQVGYVKVNTGEFDPRSGYVSSQFIEIEDNAYYILSLDRLDPKYLSNSIANIGFYDSEKKPMGNPVKMYYPSLNELMGKIRIHTPYGARYIVFTLHQNDAQDISHVSLTFLKKEPNLYQSFRDKDAALFYMADYYASYDTSKHIMADKNVLAFGDSITTYPWLEFVNALLPMKSYRRYGNSGGTYAMGKGLASRDIIQMIQQAIQDCKNKTIEKPDVIFLFGGINDTSKYFPGNVKEAWEADELTDDLKKTTAGALRYIFELIWEEWLGVDIYLMTPYQNPNLTFAEGYGRKEAIERNMTVNKIITDTSNYANCKLIDCFRLLPVNMFVEKNRIGRYLVDDGGLIHPSTGGIIAIAKCVADEYVRYNAIKPSDRPYNAPFL